MHRRLIDARPFDLLSPSHVRKSIVDGTHNYIEKYIKTNSFVPVLHLMALYTSLGYGLTHLYKRPYMTTRMYH